jgi:hypothetical protein
VQRPQAASTSARGFVAATSDHGLAVPVIMTVTINFKREDGHRTKQARVASTQLGPAAPGFSLEAAAAR